MSGNPAVNSSAQPANSNTNTQGPRSKGRRRPWQWRPSHPWRLEIGALSLSTAFLVATAAVLFSFNGKPLTSWNTPWHISLITVTSLLMIGCPVTLMFAVAECLGQLKWVYFEQRGHSLLDFHHFDEATRGPWSAISLIWHVRGRALVASVGSLITVLALAIAMDPFTQQVISSGQGLRNDTSGTASLWTSSSWDRNLRGVFGSSVTLSTAYGALDVSSAILNGLTEDPDNELFSCSSGNCTWESFTSLDICSSCTDVSYAMKKTCLDLPDPRPETEQNREDLNFFGIWNCNYTTPLNLSLQTTTSIRPAKWNLNEATLWNSASSDDAGTLTLPHITKFASIRFPEDYTANCTPWNCDTPTPLAYECDTHFCLKTWPPRTVINGTLDKLLPIEKPLVVPFDYDREQNCRGRGDCSPEFLHCFEDAYSPERPDDPYAATHFAGYSQEDYPPEVECPTWGNQQNSTKPYWIGDHDREVLYSDLASYLQVPASDCYSTQGFHISNFVNTQGLGTLLYNGHNGNFSAMMNAVTSGITNVIRQTSPNRTLVPGQAQYMQPVVVVNWPWLALPAALLLFSAIFLSFTIMFSSENSDVVWKSSSLAPLFHGLDNSEWDPALLKQRSVQEMEGVAKGMSTRLEGPVATDLKLKKG